MDPKYSGTQPISSSRLLGGTTDSRANIYKTVDSRMDAVSSGAPFVISPEVRGQHEKVMRDLGVIA